MKTFRFFSILNLLFGVTVLVHAAPPATQPVQEVNGKVIKVVGKVQHGAIGKNNWVNTKPGDVLDAGTEIRTGLRSSALIHLHGTTLIQVKSATRIALTELARSASTEKTRMFLNYGTVRGGIIEGRYHSDFQIACPAAVLSREGTWGFEMSYDPATGHFYIGLDTEGLIRVLQTTTGRRITLTPGQFVTQAMRLWIETAIFQRTVQFVDPFGTTTVEQLFYALNSDGRTVIDPTGSGDLQNSLQQGIGSIGNERLQQARIEGRIVDPQILNRLNEQFERRATPTYPYRFGNFGTHISDGPSSPLNFKSRP